MTARVYVLAGRCREAIHWQVDHPGVPGTYVSCPEKLFDKKLKPEQIAIVGTFWRRDNANLIWEAAKEAINGLDK